MQTIKTYDKPSTFRRKCDRVQGEEEILGKEFSGFMITKREPKSSLRKRNSLAISAVVDRFCKLVKVDRNGIRYRCLNHLILMDAMTDIPVKISCYFYI